MAAWDKIKAGKLYLYNMDKDVDRHGRYVDLPVVALSRNKFHYDYIEGNDEYPTWLCLLPNGTTVLTCNFAFCSEHFTFTTNLSTWPISLTQLISDTLFTSHAFFPMQCFDTFSCIVSSWHFLLIFMELHVMPFGNPYEANIILEMTPPFSPQSRCTTSPFAARSQCSPPIFRQFNTTSPCLSLKVEDAYEAVLKKIN